MNIRFLETLIWLNRSKSFSRTAEKLNTTQPGVSSRIQKLEELLNVRIYDRSARNFELTPAGRHVLNYAEKIVALSTEMRTIANGDGKADVPIRVGVIEIVTLTWLPALISFIKKRYPQLVVEFRTDVSGALVDELKNDNLDVVFVVGPVNQPGMVNSPICAMAIEWMANPAHFNCAKITDVVELSRLPVMMGAPGSSGREQLLEYFHRYGVLDVPSAGHNITVDVIYSLATAAHVVRAGLGVGALPTFLMTQELKSGAVQRLPVRQTLTPFEIVACHRPSNAPIALVETILSLAIEAAHTYENEHGPGVATWS